VGKKKSQSESTETTSLPAAPDVEKSVLGTIFLSELAYHEMVNHGLQVDYFYFDSNRRIFRVVQQLCQAKQPLDLLAVIDELDRRKEAAAVGGIAYLSSLCEGTLDGAVDMAKWVEILREKWMRRQAIAAANRLAACALDPSDSIRYSIGGTTEDLLKIQGETCESEAGFVAESTAEVLAEVKELMYLEREVIGLSYGIPELDAATTGLRKSEITTVGAYPGAGKTAFALNVCRKAAESGVPSLFFSMEMTRSQLILRLIADVSDIGFAKLRDPRNLHSSEFRQLQHWIDLINQLPIVIDDKARHISEIIPRAHLHIRKHKVGLIAFDYLQLMEAPGDTEYERVTNASDAIWQLGKSTQVPILCLSQLARPENRVRGTNIVPNMHQLRSSGKIEQNTHNVLLLHRPYSEDGIPTGDDLIIIGKQRNGILGRVKARFNGPSQRWEERAESEKKPQPQKAMFTENSRADD
jgi:replicative DNA helicase